MNQFLQKQVPVRLGTREYEELRERVPRRDGWRCQFCGSRTNLEVHHQTFRSHSGDDTEQNLITLCANCHPLMHSIALPNTNSEGSNDSCYRWLEYGTTSGCSSLLRCSTKYAIFCCARRAPHEIREAGMYY
jgi:phage terminase large subunit GpA-like protein